MLRVEVIIGLIASSVAILTFMARAYANIRRGKRMQLRDESILREGEAELERLRQEMEAAEAKKPDKD